MLPQQLTPTHRPDSGAKGHRPEHRQYTCRRPPRTRPVSGRRGAIVPISRQRRAATMVFAELKPQPVRPGISFPGYARPRDSSTDAVQHRVLRGALSPRLDGEAGGALMQPLDAELVTRRPRGLRWLPTSWQLRYKYRNWNTYIELGEPGINLYRSNDTYRPRAQAGGSTACTFMRLLRL